MVGVEGGRTELMRGDRRGEKLTREKDKNWYVGHLEEVHVRLEWERHSSRKSYI